MLVRVIAVGTIKERYLAEGIAEYMKRLKPYARLAITEIDDARRSAGISRAHRDQILAREGEKILGAIPEGAYAIALAVDGKPVSSQGLAAFLNERVVSGQGAIAFIIGGDLGLAPAVLNRADLRLSLSPMTFTHQMARLILLEQIYRAFRIMRNEPYHR